MLSRDEEMIARKQILEAEEEKYKAKIESLEIQAADVIVAIEDGAESFEAYNLFEKIDRIESINYIAMKAKSLIFRVLAIGKMTNSKLLESIVFDRNSSYSERIAAITNQSCNVLEEELFEMAKESVVNAWIALERIERKELLVEFAKNINDICWKNEWDSSNPTAKTDILLRILRKINDDILLEELALISSEVDFKAYCEVIESQTVLCDIAKKAFGKVSFYFSYVIRYLDVEHLEKIFMFVCKKAGNLQKEDFVYMLMKIQSVDLVKYFFFSDIRDIIEFDVRNALMKYRKNKEIRNIVINKLAKKS